MGALIPPSPLSVARCEPFLFGHARQPSSLDVTVQATCPIYIWDSCAYSAGPHIYQQALRTTPLFDVVQTDEAAYTIKQNPDIPQTKADFLVLTSGIPLGKVNIHTPKTGAFIEVKANLESLRVTAGTSSHIRLEDCAMTCAHLCAGAKSRIGLLCHAQDITTSSGVQSLVVAHRHKIARLQATAGNNSTVYTTSVESLTVAARPNANVIVHAHDSEHTVVQARQGSTMIVDMTGKICNFHPKLLGAGIIVGYADMIKIFDPSQMPPKKGGKIILHTNHRPAHRLHNGCREPRKGIVSVLVSAP
ncbi:MAG: hypothetical protein PHW63_07235 [Alphaproteobacteria bacterium]|nr:hypothetical protein [Alphaproteobacteria bacterium]